MYHLHLLRPRVHNLNIDHWNLSFISSTCYEVNPFFHPENCLTQSGHFEIFLWSNDIQYTQRFFLVIYFSSFSWQYRIDRFLHPHIQNESVLFVDETKETKIKIQWNNDQRNLHGNRKTATTCLLYVTYIALSLIQPLVLWHFSPSSCSASSLTLREVSLSYCVTNSVGEWWSSIMALWKFEAVSELRFYLCSSVLS